ncbi:hypothetical protein J2853_001952 [Streptosporangium lutulentum]|uniref:Transposase n=1 Tax=Streptosporangium lutulentum TaxID=1461250 RepID=A0ABT9Q7L6_9ACTN|nr:hypothetical protein [Streptosporangium lutulentum]
MQEVAVIEDPAAAQHGRDHRIVAAVHPSTKETR